MARYVDVHPRNPQPRSIAQVAALLRDGALVAYPTDSCYALGCSVDNPNGADRMRRIRHLDPHHHFTLVCANFGQLGEYVQLGTAAFRAIKAATPGPYLMGRASHARWRFNGNGHVAHVRACARCQLEG